MRALTPTARDTTRTGRRLLALPHQGRSQVDRRDSRGRRPSVSPLNAAAHQRPRPEPPVPPGLPLFRIDRDQSFPDPMLGGRLQKKFGKLWSFIGRATVAGFGLTDGADPTRNPQLWVSARVLRRIRLLLGYRWLDIDDEITDDNFALDIHQEGPLFALNYSFH